MKLKSIFFVVIFVTTIQSMQALTVNVVVMSVAAQVKPIWGGVEHKFSEKYTPKTTFSTIGARLQGLEIVSGSQCSHYDLRPFDLKGYGTIDIFIGENFNIKSIRVVGYRDFFRTKGSYINQEIAAVSVGACNQVFNG